MTFIRMLEDVVRPPQAGFGRRLKPNITAALLLFALLLSFWHHNASCNSRFSQDTGGAAGAAAAASAVQPGDTGAGVAAAPSADAAADAAFAAAAGVGELPAAAAAAGPVACTRVGALAALHAGEWQQLTEQRCEANPRVASCTMLMGWQWAWTADPPCGARQHTEAELRKVLARKNVLFLGDSHVRAMFTYTVRMLDGTFAKKIDEYSKGWNSDSWHGSSSTGAKAASAAAADLHVELLWRTAVPQVRDELRKLQLLRKYPDVVVLSLGNWYHQLKLTEEQLVKDLAELAVLVASMDSAARAAGRDILWLQVTLPTRIHGRSSVSTWNTPPALIPRYNKLLRASPLVHPRGPVLLLDVHAIAEPCLVWCSPDGLHANAAVNAVAIQILANLLGLPREAGVPAQ